MAYDPHKNLSYSTVLTAPSPATSGTSLVVQSADGAKFPTVPFNATIWPAGTQPITTNAEIVRVTAISTDTFTITRTQEGTSARTVVVGDQIAATITSKTVTDIEGGTLGLFDYVVSGCVWSGDAYASTRAASMTAGTIWLNNVKLSAAAVTARTFTASKDTYIDLTDNGDGTAAFTYVEVANNAASPALTASSIRIGIIVTGATTIAAAGSVNQGQETMLLPIASSIPYAVTDSLGDLICPRDPSRRTLGYRQILADVTSTTVTTFVDVTGLSVPFIVPTGRKIKATLYQNASNGNGGMSIAIRESTTTLQRSDIPAANLWYSMSSVILTPSAGLHTYLASMSQGSAGTMNFRANAVYPAFLLIELA